MFLSAVFLVAALAVPMQAAPEYPAKGEDVYDVHADGMQQVDAAVAQAKRENKHVLVDLGANWCPWCHKLHRTFTTAPEVKERLARDYVLVYIDVNARHGTQRNAPVNQRLGNPIKEGLPVLVVLDAAGRPLTTQETGALESGDNHDPAKITAFLNRWAK